MQKKIFFCSSVNHYIIVSDLSNHVFSESSRPPQSTDIDMVDMDMVDNDNENNDNKDDKDDDNKDNN